MRIGNTTTASVTGVQVAPAKSAIRDLPIAKVWAFAVGQFGWALLSGIISNWLVYFYQPDQETISQGQTVFVPLGLVVLGIVTEVGGITAIARFFDAYEDQAVEYKNPPKKTTKKQKKPKKKKKTTYLDGASHIQIFTKIILPITKPALAVVGMFAFLYSWNDFLSPLVYLNSEKKYTVALGLQLFTGSYRGEWNLMMAAACLVLAPVVIVFAIGQKYLVEGVTMSGVKG